jgi:hypothetical protein
MSNLFSSEANKVKIVDKIAITQNAKWENCLNEWNQNKNLIFIAWFNETSDAFNNYITSHSTEQPQIYSANETQFVHIQNDPVIFLEHYPLHSKEIFIFEKLHLKEAIVYSSLDEPLFIHVGGGKISELMQSLGMKENEILENNMISTSIKRLQKKLEEKITVEQTARSQQQWMNANAVTH